VFVLISIAIGIVVGVAEVVVYASYLRRVREAKRKEESLKERKAFVQTVHISGSSDDGDDDHRTGGKGEDDDHGEMARESLGRDDPKKEEIWGRGINGGMRRRVKERWGRENEKENDTDQGDS
jgi:TMEM199 family protein